MVKHRIWLLLLAIVVAGCTGDNVEESAFMTTSSGLKYRDVIVGSGDEAKSGDSVEVHYTGWLYESGAKGTQFDTSSDGDPLPVTLGVTRVIEGWTEGLAGMKLGGTRELIIPPALAYGTTGAPPVIPPDATLFFEVNVVKLMK